jgi:hypothetical protein
MFMGGFALLRRCSIYGDVFVVVSAKEFPDLCYSRVWVFCFLLAGGCGVVTKMALPVALFMG